MSLGDAKETSVAPVLAVFVFVFFIRLGRSVCVKKKKKKEQRLQGRPFLGDLIGRLHSQQSFGKSLVKHCGASQVATGQREVDHVIPHLNEKKEEPRVMATWRS